MKPTLFLGALIVAVSVAGGARAQTVTMKADDVILARQAGMSLMGGSAAAMKAAVAAGADGKAFAEDVAGMVKFGKAYPGLFPDGTQSGQNTKAKPEIWSDRAGFEKVAASFVVAAEKLEAAAKAGDKTAFADGFKGLGEACGACHRAYKNR